MLTISLFYCNIVRMKKLELTLKELAFYSVLVIAVAKRGKEIETSAALRKLMEPILTKAGISSEQLSQAIVKETLNFINPLEKKDKAD